MVSLAVRPPRFELRPSLAVQTDDSKIQAKTRASHLRQGVAPDPARGVERQREATGRVRSAKSHSKTRSILTVQEAVVLHVVVRADEEPWQHLLREMLKP